jgi:hypothetical protein
LGQLLIEFGKHAPNLARTGPSATQVGLARLPRLRKVSGSLPSPEAATRFSRPLTGIELTAERHDFPLQCCKDRAVRK